MLSHKILMRLRLRDGKIMRHWLQFLSYGLYSIVQIFFADPILDPVPTRQ
jgi:hypothetical protein